MGGGLRRGVLPGEGKHFATMAAQVGHDFGVHPLDLLPVAPGNLGELLAACTHPKLRQKALKADDALLGHSQFLII